MFKSWQVFVFSLVPLALVFAGVIIGSMNGVDSRREVFPTAAPRPENGNAEPQPTAAPGTTALTIVAQNLAFDPEALSAPAGQPVALTMDNQDAGVLHNVSVYADRGFSQPIFQGELVTGVTSITYNFDAPSTPGTYPFRCDVHPDTMVGQLTVN